MIRNVKKTVELFLTFFSLETHQKFFKFVAFICWKFSKIKRCVFQLFIVDVSLKFSFSNKADIWKLALLSQKLEKMLLFSIKSFCKPFLKLLMPVPKICFYQCFSFKTYHKFPKKIVAFYVNKFQNDLT